MLTYLLPTYNRHSRLRQTLDILGDLSGEAHESIGGAEVIVVDNASDPPIALPRALPNGWALRLLRRETNEGAAARNVGAQQAAGEWIVMLDDDSYPLDANHVEVLMSADDDIAAIGAEIMLTGGARESGGLPEVFIGCGVAIRRDVFLDAGGYDPAFDYYAEEYDLCAKLLLNGWRVVHAPRFRVRHEKIAGGRDMDRILHRLVRNNCWMAQRYAPADRLDAELHETIARYARIAVKENAACGFAKGMAEVLHTLPFQPRRPMPLEVFDRFTGLAHTRAALANEPRLKPGARVAIVDEGKNAWAVRQALREMDVEIVTDERDADVHVIGTLSPGPMLDAWERRSWRGGRVICPGPMQIADQLAYDCR